MVNPSKELSLQEGSLREMVSELKPAEDFWLQFLPCKMSLFIYSDYISIAMENELVNRPVNARSAGGLTF